MGPRRRITRLGSETTSTAAGDAAGIDELSLTPLTDDDARQVIESRASEL